MGFHPFEEGGMQPWLDLLDSGTLAQEKSPASQPSNIPEKMAGDAQKCRANKMDDGPGHVAKRSQESGSTPPASSSSQEEKIL